LLSQWNKQKADHKIFPGSNWDWNHGPTIPQADLLPTQLTWLHQSDLSFPVYGKALFIIDEHELIAIFKDNVFKVISQLELVSSFQRSHFYM
jgi:hypothetical protein